MLLCFLYLFRWKIRSSTSRRLSLSRPVLGILLPGSDSHSGVRKTATSGSEMRAKAPPSKERERKEKKGEKGAKGSGKADGKSGKGTTGRTADGRLICYAYNNEGCDGNCGMVHCCQVRGCYGAHPTWKHWQEYFAKLGDKNKTD